MKTVIEHLKAQIEAHKEEISHTEQYREMLKGRRAETPIEEREELENTIYTYYDTQSILEAQLSDLRYSLYYALRSMGYDDRQLNIFQPESCDAIKFVLK